MDILIGILAVVGYFFIGSLLSELLLRKSESVVSDIFRVLFWPLWLFLLLCAYFVYALAFISFELPVIIVKKSRETIKNWKQLPTVDK